jgi:hypothetical protein
MDFLTFAFFTPKREIRYPRVKAARVPEVYSKKVALGRNAGSHIVLSSVTIQREVAPPSDQALLRSRL